MHNFIPFGGNEFQIPDIESARIVVLPLCYENAPSYGTGSGEGPFYILNASAQLECLDEESLVNWGLMNIHTLPPLIPSDDPEQAVKQMRSAAENVMRQNKFLLSLGGDHAISIGPMMAASAIYPDVGVLQIDAHLDLRDEWNGSRYNHACVMRRVAEDIKLPMVQVGIRSFSPEEAEFVKKKGFKPFYAHETDPLDNTWMEQVADALPEKVYMTIDLDGLDPSVIPGTGTPEPGGLSYRQVVRLIKAVGRKKKIVAADINELAKIKGTQVSEFTAAKIATKIFVYCFGNLKLET
ncbi:Agmatinase (Agmatine ureohydrolase) [Desulfonema magnum]|uniref:Agmatinase (Agmatine ureohydrolase) n=2 Tax=Desulfonema magnum TaxID=45655 RepID=A0A975BU74_9BACT|nr:Agmatinase (Agmatine ureohydrolase) [Desulfonema magnum]